MDTFIQQIINGLVLGSVYALVALGYTMVYGIINLINFAHGEVLMVGALTSWTVVTQLRGAMPDWLLLIVSLVAAIIVCAALNFTIEKIAYHAEGNQRKLEMVDRDCFTVAPFDGHYECVLECGTRVRKGDIVGYLHDFDHIDMDPWPAKAGVDGVVLAQAWCAPIPRGQHCVVVGREIE